MLLSENREYQGPVAASSGADGGCSLDFPYSSTHGFQSREGGKARGGDLKSLRYEELML